jgi:serine/threonine-protein kinase
MAETWRADVDGRIPAPGDVLAGKYVVEGVLGAGAMGVVLSALHKQLGERVAIKLLVSARADSIDRFDREMRIIARLRGEHVVRILDAGRTEAGVPYLVMEHLRGETLADLLRREGQLSPSRAADFALQVCEGLAEAHGGGIVHRDVKPSNLFVVTRPDGTPQVKLIDFGIAKGGLLDADAELTRTDSLLGSPSYASPEQLTAPRRVDARSDVWACGVTLFRMVTGRLPFEGETLAHVCMNVVGQPAPPASTLNGEVTPALDAVIARCLEKDASDRFPTVAALAAALEPCSSSPTRGTARRVGDILQHAAASEEADAASGPRLVRTPASLEGADATTNPTPDATSTSGAERTHTGASTASELEALAPRARAGSRHLRWAAPLVALATAGGVILFTSHHDAPAAVATAATTTSEPSSSAPPAGASPATDPGPAIAAPAITASTVVAVAALPSTSAAAPAPPRRPGGPPRVRAHAPSPGGATTLVCPGDPRCTR